MAEWKKVQGLAVGTCLDEAVMGLGLHGQSCPLCLNPAVKTSPLNTVLHCKIQVAYCFLF